MKKEAIYDDRLRSSFSLCQYVKLRSLRRREQPTRGVVRGGISIDYMGGFHPAANPATDDSTTHQNRKKKRPQGRRVRCVTRSPPPPPRAAHLPASHRSIVHINSFCVVHCPLHSVPSPPPPKQPLGAALPFAGHLAHVVLVVPVHVQHHHGAYPIHLQAKDSSFTPAAPSRERNVKERGGGKIRRQEG